MSAYVAILETRIFFYVPIVTISRKFNIDKIYNINDIVFPALSIVRIITLQSILSSSSSGSHTVFSCYDFSLLYLECFLSLSLSFMTLTFLKNLGQFFYIIFLSVGSSNVSSILDSGYASLVISYTSDIVLSSVYHIWRPRMAICPSTVVLILTTQSRYYLVSSLYTPYFFPCNSLAVCWEIP